MLILAADITVFQAISAVFFSLFALLLMGVILLQRGRGVGLAGAFGGAGGAATFGAKTGDIFTWATIILFAIYVLMAIGLNFVFRSSTADVNPPPAITDAAPPSSTGDAPADAPFTGVSARPLDSDADAPSPQVITIPAGSTPPAPADSPTPTPAGDESRPPADAAPADSTPPADAAPSNDAMPPAGEPAPPAEPKPDGDGASGSVWPAPWQSAEGRRAIA